MVSIISNFPEKVFFALENVLDVFLENTHLRDWGSFGILLFKLFVRAWRSGSAVDC